jgi:hypothetical protein
LRYALFGYAVPAQKSTLVIYGCEVVSRKAETREVLTKWV